MKKVLVVGGGRISLSHVPHVLQTFGEDLTIVEPSFFNRRLIGFLTRAKCYKALGQLNVSDFDFALILTPPHLHRSLAERCLQRGVPCFIEKPAVLSLDEFDALTRMAQDNNTFFTDGYVYRYHPIIQALKNWIMQNSTVAKFDICMVGNVAHDDEAKDWRSVGLSSGVLWDYGCHVIDIANFLLNGLSNDVSIAHSVFEPKSNRLDEISLIVAGECNTTISANWKDTRQRKANWRGSFETQAGDQVIFDQYSIRFRNADGTESFTNINTLDSDVQYYLRGEDFSRQWGDFADYLNRPKSHQFEHMLTFRDTYVVLDAAQRILS